MSWCVEENIGGGFRALGFVNIMIGNSESCTAAFAGEQKSQAGDSIIDH